MFIFADTIIVEPLKLSNIRHMLNDIPIFDESNVTLSDINNESHDTESLSVCEDSCFAAPWKDFNGDEDGSLETMDIETEKFFLLDNNNQKDKQSIRETGNQTLTPSEQNLNTSKKNAFKVDYALHCEKCEKTFVKVPRKKMTKCKNCKKDFFYDCLKCSKRYVTLTGVYLHHKLNKCPGLPNFDKISVQTKFNVSRKRSFSFKNFYSLYCGTCKKTFNKIPGKRLSKCPKCKKDLMYDCINCTKRYISIPGLYLHIKLNKCPGVQGFNQINFENKNDKLCKDSSLKFLCAHCNFSAKQKGNLLIHINRKHMPRKCQVCNEEFETYDRYKTHRQERCFKVKKSKEEQKAKKIPDNENYKNEESKSYAEKLKSSENSTTGNRKFQCAHCFYKAYREEHLVRHVYDNHNFEP